MEEYRRLGRTVGVSLYFDSSENFDRNSFMIDKSMAVEPTYVEVVCAYIVS